MNFKQLTYFTRIAERGSFSSAARDLQIAQSALSLQISKFEQQLGISLFHRSRRGSELTESGERLLIHAQAILQSVEIAEQDIQPDHIEPKGVIRIGMIPTINNLFASELYRAASLQYPKLRIDMLSGPSHYLHYLLESGQLDLSIAHADKLGFGEMTVEPILREVLHFVYARSRGCEHVFNDERGTACIEFRDVAHHSILSTEYQDGLGFRIKQYAEKQGIALDRRPSLGQLATDITEISKGDVCMILPYSAIYNQVDKAQLCTARIVKPDLERDVFMISNPKRRVSRNVVKMMELILAQLTRVLKEANVQADMLT